MFTLKSFLFYIYIYIYFSYIFTYSESVEIILKFFILEKNLPLKDN